MHQYHQGPADQECGCHDNSDPGLKRRMEAETRSKMSLEEASSDVLAYELAAHPFPREAGLLLTLRIYTNSPIAQFVSFKQAVHRLNPSDAKEFPNRSEQVLPVSGAVHGETFTVYATILTPDFRDYVPVLFTQLLEPLGHGYCSCGYWDWNCWCCQPQTFSRNCIGQSAWQYLVNSICNGWFCSTYSTWAEGCV